LAGKGNRMAYKRFLVFGYDNYYPAGGSNDVVVSTDTLDEAEDFIRQMTHGFDYFDILDMETRKWVYGSMGKDAIWKKS